MNAILVREKSGKFFIIYDINTLESLNVSYTNFFSISLGTIQNIQYFSEFLIQALTIIMKCFRFFPPKHFCRNPNKYEKSSAIYHKFSYMQILKYSENPPFISENIWEILHTFSEFFINLKYEKFLENFWENMRHFFTRVWITIKQ